MRIFNSMGKKLEEFTPVSRKETTIFTCGPSVYQRAHIGNFRTFLFEDIVVRYLEYSGHNVKRGMNYTDVEDKAVREAYKRGITVPELTSVNIREFQKEMRQLGMKIPDYFPRASENVDNALEILEILLQKGIAYRHGINYYFDPLKFPGFGKLYGLDMRQWPKRRKRFHLDTYPGMRWNLGDFILWHGCRALDVVCWDAPLGRGRPSWNIQDQAMILPYFHETLSIYMGGIDNMVRHHDYIIAVLESVRPYPVARFWLHCHHLFVEGRKMSKSLGNILYTNDVLAKGFSARELRFFLIYNHYRGKVNFTWDGMAEAAGLLRQTRSLVRRAAAGFRTGKTPRPAGKGAAQWAGELRAAFRAGMDNDLNVRQAFDGMKAVLDKAAQARPGSGECTGLESALREIDSVLGVLF